MKFKVFVSTLILSALIILNGCTSTKSVQNVSPELDNLKKQISDQDIKLKNMQQSYDNYATVNSLTYEVLNSLYTNNTKYVIDTSVAGTKIEDNVISFPNSDKKFTIPKNKLELWQRGFDVSQEDNILLMYDIKNVNLDNAQKTLYVRYKKVGDIWKLTNMDIDH